MFKVRLFPLFDMDGDIGAESGVEAVPAAEVQTETPQIETTSEPGAEPEVAAEPEKQNNFEKAFAKRLAAKEAEWEAKNSEKYKDYDTLKKTTEYFQQRHGYNDLMTMKEDIELAELQERAEQENLPPATLKRIDELEAKAAKFEEYEKQQEQTKEVHEFRAVLDPFAEKLGLNADELHKFMFENDIGNMDIAAKAMKAEEYERLANEKESDTIKRYLESKQAPRVEGSTGAAGIQGVDTSKMGWKDLEKHAAARLEASKTPS